LEGALAFKAERYCEICRAKELKRTLPETRIPHIGHHPLCLLNIKTKGKGNVSAQTEATLKEAKCLESLFSKPLEPHENGSWKHSTKEAGITFFQPRKTTINTKMKPDNKPENNNPTLNKDDVGAREICKGVAELVENTSFCEKHNNKVAPLAMIAFATVISKKIICGNVVLSNYFCGLSREVPV
jgi:hypothetical protein